MLQLGDFGLVKLLLGKSYFTNRSGSGTVTHLAPELFQVCFCCGSVQRLGPALHAAVLLLGGCPCYDNLMLL